MSPSDLRERFFRLPWFRIRNGTGSQIPPCSILLISSWTTNNNNMLATVVQPNSSSTDFNWDGYCISGPFAVGAGSSDEGLAVCGSEPWFARYDSGTPAKGQGFGPKHGQLTLSRHYYGFQALGLNTTFAGNNVTLVKWRGIQTVYGQVNDSGTIAVDATCTVNVYKGDRSGAAGSMTITATNRFVSLSSVNGKNCTVVMGAETPELIAVKCA